MGSVLVLVILAYQQESYGRRETIPAIPYRLTPCEVYNSEMKVRDAIRLIQQDGWFLVATRGSHRQYKHPRKPGLVTIAGKPSDELAPGTKNSILKQAGLK